MYNVIFPQPLKNLFNLGKGESKNVIEIELKEAFTIGSHLSEKVSTYLISNNLTVDTELRTEQKYARAALNSFNVKYFNIEKLELEPFPSPEVLSKLSCEVYNKPKDNMKPEFYRKTLNLPTDWKLLSTASNKDNGYFGAAYYNMEQMQIVVAHKGTDDIKSGITDLIGVFMNHFASQICSAITFVDKVLTWIKQAETKDRRFQLSITGHSLGGWLAQVTTLSSKYFQMSEEGFFERGEDKFHGYHAHTVVFESPGCKDMLNKLIDFIDLRYDPSMFIDHLDITTYLNAPNRINTITTHVGIIYRIEDNFEQKSGLLWNMSYDLFTHKIENNSTAIKNEATQYQVQDWPSNPWFVLQSNEYKEFFSIANQSNNYNPKENTERVRYRVRDADSVECCLRVFTQDEKDFLKGWKVCQQAGLKLNIIKKYLSEKKLGSVQNLLPRYEFHSDNHSLVADTRTLLIQLVARTKQIMRWFPEITDSIKKQLLEIPTSAELISRDKSEQLQMSLPETDIELNDTIGLATFLESKYQIMYLLTDSTDLELIKLLALIKQIRETNSNVKTSGFVDKDNILFINWSQRSDIEKYVDLNDISKLKFRLYVLVLSCADISSFYKYFSNFSNTTNDSDRKIIVVTLFECVDEKRIVIDDRTTVVETNNKDVLNEESLTTIMKKNIFIGKFRTLSDVLGYDKVEMPWIKKIITDDKILKNLLATIPEKTTLQKIKTNNTMDYANIKVVKKLSVNVIAEYIISDIQQQCNKKSKPDIFVVIGNVENSNKFRTELQNTLKMKIKNFDDVKNYIFDRIVICHSFVYDQSELFLEFYEKNLCNRIHCIKVTHDSITWKRTYDSELYIERQFIHETYIDIAIRNLLMETIQTNNYFVFYNLENSYELAEKLRVPKTLEKRIVDHLNIQVVKSEIEALKLYYENIQTCNAPVHLIKYVNEQFIWQKSEGSLDVFRRYRRRKRGSTISEKELVDRNARILILADVPGTGKSTSFRGLAKGIDSPWVVSINMKDRGLMDKMPKDLNIDSVADFLLSCMLNNSINYCVVIIFKYNLLYNDRMPINIFFDGFDELQESKMNHQDKTTNELPESSVFLKLLTFLKEKTVAKIFISTRIHRSQILENHLSVFSVELQEITEQQQKEYLKRFWLSCLRIEVNVDESFLENLEKYVNYIYNRIKSVIGVDINNFIGVPLQVRLIAEVVVPIVDSKLSQCIFSMPEFSNNIYDLYNKFVKAKFTIYFKEKTKLSDYLINGKEISLMNWFNKYQQIIAFRLLLPNLAEVYLGNKKLNDFNENFTETIVEDLNRIGLLQSINKKEHKFIHTTIKEHFVAQLIVSWLKKSNGRNSKYPSTECFLLRYILLQPKFRMVRYFLNAALTNVTIEISEESANDIANEWFKDARSFLGEKKKTALHVLVEENHYNLTKLCLSTLKYDTSIKILVSYFVKRDKDGNTPLNVAFRLKDDGIFKMFLDEISKCDAEIQKHFLLATIFKTENIQDDDIYEHIMAIKDDKLKTLKTILEQIKKMWTNITDFVQIEDLMEIRDPRIRIYVILATNLEGDTLLHTFTDEENKESLEYCIMQTIKDWIFVLGDSKTTRMITRAPAKEQAVRMKCMKRVTKQYYNYQLNRSIRHKKILLNWRFSKTIVKLWKQIYRRETFSEWFRRNNEVESFLGQITWELVNTTGYKGQTPIFAAARSGNLPIIKLLMNYYGSLEFKNENSMTAIGMASIGGHLDVVKYLIDIGGDYTISERNGITSLQHAAKHGHKDLVEYFINETDQDIDNAAFNGLTALCFAAREGHLPIVEYLVNEGADVNAEDTQGRNVVYHAVKENKFDVVKFLMKNGGDVYVHDKEGRTALEYLIKARQNDIVANFIKTEGFVIPIEDYCKLINMAVDLKAWEVVISFISDRNGLFDMSDYEAGRVLRHILSVVKNDLKLCINRVMKINNEDFYDFSMKLLSKKIKNAFVENLVNISHVLFIIKANVDV